MIEKASLLIQNNRFDEAEQMLLSVLAQDASNYFGLMLLTEVKIKREDYEAAHDLIDRAIGLYPYEGDLFYTKARIYINQNKKSLAEEQLNQAIQINPNDADYHALLGHTLFLRKQFKEALAKANTALEIEADNTLALNVRSSALQKLNRTEDAYETIEGALREDPNNPFTHANYGWTLLEQGQVDKSLEHFKMALQNNPNFEYAQGGMLEALKSKNLFYRWYMKYVFFMDKLGSKYQWGVIIGFYMLVKVLRGVADSNDTLAPFLYPIVIALTIFAFSTWVMHPIGNLFLRLNKYGQFLLDKQEKMSSNFVGLGLLTSLFGLILYAFTSDLKFLPLAAFGFGMMPPFSVMFTETKIKNILIFYTIAMFVVGSLAAGISLYTGALWNTFSGIFLIGFIAFQWLANYLIIGSDE